MGGRQKEGGRGRKGGSEGGGWREMEEEGRRGRKREGEREEREGEEGMRREHNIKMWGYTNFSCYNYAYIYKILNCVVKHF